MLFLLKVCIGLHNLNTRDLELDHWWRLFEDGFGDLGGSFRDWDERLSVVKFFVNFHPVIHYLACGLPGFYVIFRVISLEILNI